MLNLCTKRKHASACFPFRIINCAYHLLTFGLSLWSCKTEPIGTISPQNQTVSIDLGQARAEFMSKIFDDIDYVFLDYHDSVPLARLAFLRFDADEIYIHDRGLDNVAQFERNGTLKRVFQSKGAGGPGEFMHIEDFQARGDTLIIADARQNKLIAYSADGRYLFSAKSPFTLSDVYFSPNFQLYHLNNVPENLERHNFVRVSGD